MQTWSSLPYYAPTFYKSGSGDVVYSAASMAQNADGSWSCGRENDSYSIQQGKAFIVSATIYLNSTTDPNFPGYSDGPSTNGSCDIRDVELHETGHAFGLGHSSVKTDLMYTKVNNVESVGQDEQNAMAAIYGTYDAGCSSSDCGGHADISTPPSPIVLHPLTAARLEQITLRKAQAAEQALLAMEKDAGNMANSARHQVTNPTICTTNCDPPPGGPAPRPTPIVPS